MTYPRNLEKKDGERGQNDKDSGFFFFFLARDVHLWAKEVTQPLLGFFQSNLSANGPSIKQAIMSPSLLRQTSHDISFPLLTIPWTVAEVRRSLDIFNREEEPGVRCPLDTYSTPHNLSSIFSILFLGVALALTWWWVLACSRRGPSEMHYSDERS